jgi:hypothetical protein
MHRQLGATTTGDEVLQGMDLTGKVAIVTGEPEDPMNILGTFLCRLQF